MGQGKGFEMTLLSSKYLFGDAVANNLEDRYVSVPGEQRKWEDGLLKAHYGLNPQVGTDEPCDASKFILQSLVHYSSCGLLLVSQLIDTSKSLAKYNE